MKKEGLNFIVCVSLVLASFSIVSIPLASADGPPVPTQAYPSDGSSGVTIFINLRWKSDDPSLTYDVYFGTENPPGLVNEQQSETTYDPGGLSVNTSYFWQIVAFNSEQEFTPGPIWSFITADNQPPFKPRILKGPTAAGPGILSDFVAIAPDPEGDHVYYQWDWGDGNVSDWLGPFDFGQQAAASYQWVENGTYDITVRAKDVGGEQSDWSSSFQISIAPQIEIINFAQGFLYLNFFGSEQGYAFVYALDVYNMSMVIHTGSFQVRANVSDNVKSVIFEMKDLFFPSDRYFASDDNFTDRVSYGSFVLTNGLYQTTAIAYDEEGRIIDRHVREYVICYEWTFRLIKGLFNRLMRRN